ncbi:MAG: DUF4870 domain-containing protein [Xanthomonadales bacterium]|nr:DUF4870 domain-containing protein [Xanthomonadales bacterium]
MSDEQAAAPTPPPPVPPSDSGSPTAEERQWALFAHLSALSGFLIPFGNILGPLVIWLIKKDQLAFVNDQGKEALNFQITVMIAVLVSAGLTVILIGFLLLPIVGIGALVLTIMAAVKANGGERYRYPFTLRLVS